ncbi:methyl-accepting chemotaxis protein [Streptomyces sp. NPDC008121]|uniref:methyl-accepting chemotaxis protein n=1 Tax=Streptomyces sp. NPDC008121 TaxID=3364809 RepID=UPI0036E429D6
MPVRAPADRSTVARQIEELAAEAELSARAGELKALSRALRADDDSGLLDPWADLDLLHAYARPESVDQGAPEQEHAAWGWLETLLGGLVFVPLALTWLGLTRATSAYEALTGADPRAAGRPFLQLWQSGFEGRLTGFFTFGHVALFATIAILVLLALVLLHGWRKATVGRRAEEGRRRADALLRRLVPVLTQAQLHLNDHRMASPQRFAAELTKSAATLTRLGDKAATTQQELTHAATLVGDSVDKAERRLAGIDTSVRPLESAANRIEEAVRGNTKEIEAAVSGSGATVRQALEDVREMSGEVRDVVDRAGERVEDSVTVLAASQRSFTTGIEVTGDVSAQILGRLTEVVDATARGSAEARELLGRLAAQTEALGRVAERFGDAVEALRTMPAAPAAPGTGYEYGPEREPYAGRAGGHGPAGTDDGPQDSPRRPALPPAPRDAVPPRADVR